MAVPPIAPDMLASIMLDARGAGKPIEQQQDAAHLPLFVHANEPKFICPRKE